MGEVEFRAKTPKGEWVYGFYLQEYQDNGQIKHYILRSWFDGTRVFKHKDTIIPGTVCQYTGLKDKNGKKIFAGDILYRNHWGKLDEKNPIVCKLYNGSFCFTEYCTWDYANNCKRAWFWNRRFNKRRLKSCEVVGNVYDNPEL